MPRLKYNLATLKLIAQGWISFFYEKASD